MIVLAPDFMTKIGKKAAQDFFCAVSKVVDRVKTVVLMVRKKKYIKDHKGYGSAARSEVAYGDSSSHNCGGAVRWCYRKSRDRT